VRTQPDDLYFVNPFVDALFVGGISIACFLLVHTTLTGFEKIQVSTRALWLVSALLWVGNWPHIFATSYRLYESRERVRRFYLTAALLPGITVLAILASLLYPASFAPYFVKLYMLWSPYHFSAQTMGLALIYARRAALPVSKRARRAFTAFFVSTFLVQVASTEKSFTSAFVYAIVYPQLRIPDWTPIAFESIMYVSLAVLALELLPEMLKLKRFPWIVPFLLFTHALWFVYGAGDFNFQIFVPFFHSLQYLLVAWSLEMYSRGTRHPARQTAAWMAITFAGGAALFFGVPHLLAWRGVNLDFAVLVVTAGVTGHHFFVDGVLWKLHREGAGSPLFRNVARAWRERSSP
jgi:hypothetical protein